jgi:uroporphyrin-III C-methyltransferase
MNTSTPPSSMLSRVPWLSLLLCLALGGHWWVTRTQMGDLQEQLAKRLREGDAANSEARTLAKQANESVKDATAKLAKVEARLAESQSQQAALEQLYQSLARNRDEWALAEIEQVITLAAQQLQLAGNVSGALVALQNADARLGRAANGAVQAQFLPIRRVLQKDIEKLRAIPYVDVPGIALKLDAVMGAVDNLPLAFDERLKPAARDTAQPVQAAADESTLSRWANGAWREMRQLVRVRDMSGTEPVVLAPNESFFLRENLKLRLINARIALMQRNDTLFRADVQASQLWLARHFDVRSEKTIAAIGALKGLSNSSLAIEPPSLADSLNAVRNFRPTRDGK